MTIRNWIAFTLLALCIGEALAIRHLLAHRNIVIQMSPTGWTIESQTNKYGCVEPSDYYDTSAADPGVPCGSFEPANVCCIKI